MIQTVGHRWKFVTHARRRPASVVIKTFCQLGGNIGPKLTSNGRNERMHAMRTKLESGRMKRGPLTWLHARMSHQPIILPVNQSSSWLRDSVEIPGKHCNATPTTSLSLGLYLDYYHACTL
jgi:hypothetical protein